MDPAPGRRRVLAALAGVATGLAGCGRSPPDADDGQGATGSPGTADATGTPGATESPGTTEPTETDASPPDAVGLETVVDGLEAPLDVAFAPDADRRYVLTRPGRIHVHEGDGLRDEPFLDLRESVVLGGERGLLGVALHPEFAENRRLFVRYSAEPRAGTPRNYSHTFVLAEFEATADGLRARPDSERALLEIPEPQSNHNAGDVAFGPEGYLYVAVGDGGGGDDRGRGHAEDWYDAVEGGNGQDVTDNLLGSILRIDVDGEGGDRPYAVPGDNPLVGETGLDEQYAWGFRNPWRISFDGEDFYVADVGEDSYEEVNLVERGGNYGWNVYEGTHCFRAGDCPDETPADVRGGEPLRDPVVEYAHSGGPLSGVSVIGGYVYRGSALPALEGTYVFGDLRAQGRLFVAIPDGDGLWPTQVMEVAGGGLRRLLSFGRDDAGEVYALGRGADDGGVYRVVPAG